MPSLPDGGLSPHLSKTFTPCLAPPCITATPTSQLLSVPVRSSPRPSHPLKVRQRRSFMQTLHLELLMALHLNHKAIIAFVRQDVASKGITSPLPYCTPPAEKGPSNPTPCDQNTAEFLETDLRTRTKEHSKVYLPPW